MNLIQIIDKFSIDEFALVLRCLFDRIPVIIGGHDSDFIDGVLIKLCDIVSIRKEIIFGTDFLKKNEYDAIIEEEKLDYDNQRIIFRAPVHSEDSVIENFDTLKGWVIGMETNSDISLFYEKASRLREKSSISLLIKFDFENNLDLLKLYGEKASKFDASLEKRIIKKTFSETEYALERIKRVLDKKIQNKADINESIVKSLVDLKQEEAIIKESIIRKEIMEFFQASRRGLALLSRLNFLNQFQSVKIGKKAFFDAISYDKVSTPRFLLFLNAEWEEKFDDLIDNNKLSILGDHLDSLWG